MRQDVAFAKRGERSGYQPIGSEFELHRWTVQLLHRLSYQHVKFWHTPNGEERGARAAGKLAVMGVLPGVPDLIVFIRHKPHFLELKHGRGQPSIEQRAFIAWAQDQGFPVAICRTQDEVAIALETWQAIRPTGWQFGGHS